MGSTIVGRTGFDLTKVYHVVITPGGRSSPQEVKLDLPLDVDILFHDHVAIGSSGCDRKPGVKPLGPGRWVPSWPTGAFRPVPKVASQPADSAPKRCRR
jgi:hypothetical protein